MTSKVIKCIENDAYQDAAEKQAEAITREAWLWTAVQIAMMVARRAIEKHTTDLRFQLADRRMKMAEEAVAHAMKTWPYEKALVDETMDEPKYMPLYDAGVILAKTATKRAAAEMYDAFGEAVQRIAGSSGLCLLNRSLSGVRLIETDLTAHNMRSAEARALALNDRRFSRQYSVLGLGRGKLQTAMTFGDLSAYKVKMGQQLVDMIGSGMKLWGYQEGRFRSPGSWHTSWSDVPRVLQPGQQMIEHTTATGATSINITNVIPAANSVGSTSDQPAAE